MPTPTRLALFPTCLVDQIHPEIGRAAAAVLERQGFRPELPAGPACCGQPFYNAGFRPEAGRLARGTIAALEPFEAAVLPSGSCTAMIRVEYAHLFAGDPDWERRAAAVAEKTFEFSEFLEKFAPVEAPGRTDPEGGALLAYHDSCHMCRNLGLKEAPRAALDRLKLPRVEMEEPDRCCGFGGLFSLRLPEVAGSMAEEKLQQARAAGAGLLVTADPGCLMQMRRHAGEAPRVEHLAVVLEERTR